MTFTEAQRRQYLRSTIYVVYLVGPDGEREQVGTTSRKSGAGLMEVLQRGNVQVRVAALPGAATATFRKHADRLEFSNGWALVFGDTIRQESQEAQG